MISLTQYKTGEVIIREKDLGETAYVIAEGQVEVSKELNGQNVHLAYLGAGETFGEMSMIDEKPRSATVTAVKETLVSEIRRDDFFNSFQTDPKVALQLLKVLFERLREADAMILELQKAGSAPAGPDGSLARSSGSGTSYYYARRNNPASCRRFADNSFSDHTLPLSCWQTEPRSTCL